MPDEQGFATDKEILEGLKRLIFEGQDLDPVTSGQVSKVVACGGYVRVWLAQDAGPRAAKALDAHVRALPGVREVSLVPVESIK